jgi:misacylated tRNA(Ala) deacylase
MSDPLFRDAPYLQSATGVVMALLDGAIVLDRSLFYPTGGGQPGDNGRLEWAGETLEIATASKGEAGEILLVPADAMAPLPAVGSVVTQQLDWDTRYRYMRVHTALHLLSVLIPLPVTGGQIGAQKGRLDFAMPEPLEDKDAVEAALNALIERDLVVTESWITDAELAAKPEMVKTMSVKPPTGQGRVRLIRIGNADEQIDLQPCGGTHVARTSEIGRVILGKLENKGKQNRRVNILLAD